MCPMSGMCPSDPVSITIICVGGLVTSPIWVSAMAIEEGRKKGATTARRQQELEVQERVKTRMKSGEGQAHLQLLFENSKVRPTAEVFHELGVAMFVAGDMMQAEQYLSLALRSSHTDFARSMFTDANIYFSRAFTNLNLRDFAGAIDDFKAASKYLINSVQRAIGGSFSDSKDLSVARESLDIVSSALPNLTHATCLSSLANSQYLHALYSVMQTTEDDRVSQARTLLQDAVKNYDDAIAATEADPQANLWLGRGKALYYLALIDHMCANVGKSKTACVPSGGYGDLGEPPCRENTLNLSHAEKELASQALSAFLASLDVQDGETGAEAHAMTAMALAVLGRYDEAAVAEAKAYALVEGKDSAVFDIDLRSVEQLMIPAPLPPQRYGDAPHAFVPTPIYRPYLCGECQGVISVLFHGSASCCSRCDSRVHVNCQAKAERSKTCWTEKRPDGLLPFLDQARPKAPENHVHTLSPCYFSKPTWCDVCGSFCQVPYGYECTLKGCGYQMHTQCGDALPNCVIMGTETMDRLAKMHCSTSYKRTINHKEFSKGTGKWRYDDINPIAKVNPLRFSESLSIDALIVNIEKTAEASRPIYIEFESFDADAARNTNITLRSKDEASERLKAQICARPAFSLSSDTKSIRIIGRLLSGDEACVELPSSTSVQEAKSTLYNVFKEQGSFKETLDIDTLFDIAIAAKLTDTESVGKMKKYMQDGRFTEDYYRSMWEARIYGLDEKQYKALPIGTNAWSLHLGELRLADRMSLADAGVDSGAVLMFVREEANTAR